MSWQCSYHDGDGKRCENKAIKRVIFSVDHPFDYSDLCQEHLEEYKCFVWYFELNQFGVQ